MGFNKHMWWLEWATNTKKPSRGIEDLIRTGLIIKYPELHNMIGVPQDPIWHPEGDVMVHTMHVIDAAATIADREEIICFDRVVFILAALCHDMGKPHYTKFEDGRWRSRGHESGGVPYANKFLDSIGAPSIAKERILPLIADHLFHQNDASPRAVRRLSRRLHPATIKDLVLLIEADCSGRPPIQAGCPESALALLDKVKEYKIVDKGPDPILMGRHLIINKIIEPGPAMGRLLDAAFAAQLDGEFNNLEDAISWANKVVTR